NMTRQLVRVVHAHHVRRPAHDAEHLPDPRLYRRVADPAVGPDGQRQRGAAGVGGVRGEQGGGAAAVAVAAAEVVTGGRAPGEAEDEQPDRDHQPAGGDRPAVPIAEAGNPAEFRRHAPDAVERAALSRPPWEGTWRRRLPRVAYSRGSTPRLRQRKKEGGDYTLPSILNLYRTRGLAARPGSCCRIAGLGRESAKWGVAKMLLGSELMR